MIDIHHIINSVSHALIPIAHASQAAVEAAKEAAPVAGQAVTAAAEVTAETAEGGGGVAGTLGIDWKLLVPQLINFAIILLVLWKWVLTPVAKKLGERSSKIQKSLDDAQMIQEEKQKFTAWREQEMGNARKQAAEIIAQSQNEASAAKQEILNQAKQEQEKLVRQVQAQIQSEKQQALSDIKSQVADMITGAAEKILRKNLNEKTDKELIKESLKSIK